MSHATKTQIEWLRAKIKARNLTTKQAAEIVGALPSTYRAKIERRSSMDSATFDEWVKKIQTTKQGDTNVGDDKKRIR